MDNHFRQVYLHKTFYNLQQHLELYYLIKAYNYNFNNNYLIKMVVIMDCFYMDNRCQGLINHQLLYHLLLIINLYYQNQLTHHLLSCLASTIMPMLNQVYLEFI